MKSPISFAKIVSTPTPSSWSQAYNAGNLAAVIALVEESVDTQDQSLSQNLSLPSLGKELLNTLEAEYFTIESKNLETIKHAVLTTCEKLTGPVTLSLCVTVIMENILYVFLYGKGKVLMKRAGKLGTILTQSEDGNLLSGSGFIENGDIVILETDSFATIVPEDLLLPCLEHDKLLEMAETLSPVIHNKQEGAAAALAFSFHEEHGSTESEKPQEEQDIREDNFVSEKTLSQAPQEGEGKETAEEQENEQEELTPQLPKQTKGLPISHSRRLFLTIAIILAIVLVASVYFAIKKQQDTARQAYFASVIVPAQKKYDEGQSLMDINKSLARDDFASAKQMLESVLPKFPPNSKEATDGQALLQKITDAINNTAQVASVTATAVDPSQSALLTALLKNPTALYGATDGTNVYIADTTGISSVKSDTVKNVIKNSTDWATIGGFGAYLGNFYVLDKKAGILKYPNDTVPSTKYFATGVSPDLSQTVDLAIDGSIWTLDSNGTIAKYTKGNQDAFTIKGLDQPLVQPTKIVTSADDDNLYVLDRGNKRIVVLDKTGTFTAQYQTPILSNALALDVAEKDKKVFVLSGGKVYEIDLK